MKKGIFLIIVTLIFTSCATLTSKETHDLRISSKIENAQVRLQDSIYNLPATIKIKRSKEPLKIIFVSDSLQKEYETKPRLTKKFKFGNLIFTYFAPIGYVVDLTNSKRFYYGNKILIDNDTIDVSYKRINNFYEIEKGNIFVNFSFPFMNFFKIHPEHHKPISNTSNIGFSLGTDYYYSNKNFINFTYSYQMHRETSNIINQGLVREYYNFNALTLTNNHLIKRFSFGYGLTYVHYNWILYNDGYYDYNTENYIMFEDITKKHGALGLTFPAYYRIGKRLHVGLNYSPTFYTPTLSKKFTYDYVLSFDLKWKFRIKK